MVTIAVGSVWPFGAAILTAAGPDVVREAGPDHERGLDTPDPKEGSFASTTGRSTDRHHAICTFPTRDALVTFIYPTRLASEARLRAGVRHALGHLRPSVSLAPAVPSNPNSRTKKSGKPRKAQYRSRHKPKTGYPDNAALAS